MVMMAHRKCVMPVSCTSLICHNQTHFIDSHHFSLDMQHMQLRGKSRFEMPTPQKYLHRAKHPEAMTSSRAQFPWLHSTPHLLVSP